jgi:hypothetical protein
LPVTGEDYLTAIRAHEQENELLALGVLTKEGRTYVLKNPRGLQIIAELDEQ